MALATLSLTESGRSLVCKGHSLAVPGIDEQRRPNQTSATRRPRDSEDRYRERRDQERPSNDFGLHLLSPSSASSLTATDPDIIAVHGINGHAFKTWSDSRRRTFWLRDFLPQEFPKARVYSFGYDSRVFFTSGKGDLASFARNLLAQLAAALIQAKLDEQDYPDIRESVKAIVFLSTPHRGSSAVAWPHLLGKIANVALSLSSRSWGRSQTDLIKTLENESKALHDISVGFRNQVNGIKLVSCYEQNSTPPLSELIVNEQTGILGFPGEKLIPMAGCDHKTVAKFGTRGDAGYKMIVYEIKEVLGKPQESRVNRGSITEPTSFLRSLEFEGMDLWMSYYKHPDSRTCEWLLEHAQFKEWINTQKGLLWLRGKSGSGKSTLMSHCFGSIPAEQNACFTIFFFVVPSEDPISKSRLGLWGSITYQLAKKFPAAFDNLVERFERVRGVLESDTPSIWQAQELFEAVQQAIPKILQSVSLRIFVDGIDACGDDVSRILVTEFKKLTDRPAKDGHSCSICFSSHPYPLGDPFPGNAIDVEEGNKPDIELFVSHRLPNCDQGIQEWIALQAKGSFLWARLTTERLQQLGASDISQIHQEIHRARSADPVSLYAGRFHELCGQGTSQTLDLITWACLSTRPLTLTELSVALAIDDSASGGRFTEISSLGHIDENSLESWIGAKTFGILEVAIVQHKKVVRPVHDSVKDFLVRDGFKMLLSPKENIPPETLVAKRHLFLASCCVKYLVLVMRESQWETCDKSGRHWQLLSYAESAWVQHAALADRKGVSARQLSQLMQWPSEMYLEGFIRVAYRTNRKLNDGPTGETVVDQNHSLNDGSILPGLTGWLQLWSTLGLRNIINSTAQGSYSEVLNHQDNQKRTALHLAAYNGHSTTVKTLLAQGAVADMKTKQADTVLHAAVIQCQVSIQKTLLERSVVVNVKNDSGRSALSYAILREHRPSVKLLLEKGADPNDVDKQGLPLLSHATKVGNVGVITMLLDRGADSEKPDRNGHTPLFHAAMGGKKRIVSLFLERKGDANAVDANGRTPLMFAVEGGHYDVAAQLLSAGTAVNAQDKSHWTALMIAVTCGKIKTASLCLEKGADVTVQNVEGHAVIFYAVTSNGSKLISTKAGRAFIGELFNQYGRSVRAWDEEWKDCYRRFSASKPEKRPKQPSPGGQINTEQTGAHAQSPNSPEMSRRPSETSPAYTPPGQPLMLMSAPGYYPGPMALLPESQPAQLQAQGGSAFDSSMFQSSLRGPFQPQYEAANVAGTPSQRSIPPVHHQPPNVYQTNPSGRRQSQPIGGYGTPLNSQRGYGPQAQRSQEKSAYTGARGANASYYESFGGHAAGQQSWQSGYTPSTAYSQPHGGGRSFSVGTLDQSGQGRTGTGPFPQDEYLAQWDSVPPRRQSQGQGGNFQGPSDYSTRDAPTARSSSKISGIGSGVAIGAGGVAAMGAAWKYIQKSRGVAEGQADAKPQSRSTTAGNARNFRTEQIHHDSRQYTSRQFDRRDSELYRALGGSRTIDRTTSGPPQLENPRPQRCSTCNEEVCFCGSSNTERAQEPPTWSFANQENQVDELRFETKEQLAPEQRAFYNYEAHSEDPANKVQTHHEEQHQRSFYDGEKSDNFVISESIQTENYSHNDFENYRIDEEEHDEEHTVFDSSHLDLDNDSEKGHETDSENHDWDQSEFEKEDTEEENSDDEDLNLEQWENDEGDDQEDAESNNYEAFEDKDHEDSESDFVESEGEVFDGNELDDIQSEDNEPEGDESESDQLETDHNDDDNHYYHSDPEFEVAGQQYVREQNSHDAHGYNDNDDDTTDDFESESEDDFEMENSYIPDARNERPSLRQDFYDQYEDHGYDQYEQGSYGEVDDDDLDDYSDGGYDS